MRRRLLAGFSLSTLLLATGCTTVHQPDAFVPTVPAEFHERADGAESGDLAEWWHRFGDARLDALMEEAFARNLDLRLAEERILEARASLRGVQSSYLPQVGQATNYSRLRGAGSAAGLVGLPIATKERSVYSVGFDASWELGLFGTRGAATSAGRAEIGAAEARAQAVRVALAGDVAHRYFSLRAADAQIEIARESLALRRETAALASSRYRAGLVPELDRIQADAEVAGAEAALAGLTNERAKLEHSLAVLLDRDAEWTAAMLRETTALPAQPGTPRTGIPADLLRRRPDLLEAGFQLESALANTRLARAERYPQISLTGSFGRQSNEAGNLTLGASSFFAVGPAIRIPLFTGGRIESNIRAMDSRELQAALHYQSLANSAIGEVEDALSGIETGTRTTDRQARAVRGQADAVELVTNLYRAGLTNFQPVLEARRSLCAAQDESLRAQRDLLLAHVALYRALGGGWN